VAINSRAKGARFERALVKILARVWPDCSRNLDQFGPLKMDCLRTPGWHWQAKNVEALNIWRALSQAENEAMAGDVPVIAFKRNRSKIYAALELERLLDLIERTQNPSP
jgi:hypothetical protein